MGEGYLRRLIEAQRELTESFDDKPPLWTEKSPGQGRWGRGLGRPINPTSLVRQRKLAKPLITHGARVPATWRCWRRCAAPHHRVSATKRTPSGETAWGPEVRQFRLWAEQRGCEGMGEPPGPPKLCDSTAHAPAKTITPLYSTDYLFVSFSVRAEKCNSPRCLR